jgi:DNA-binding LytR/AlgR family response regulator
MQIAICDDNPIFSKKLHKKIRSYCAEHNLVCQCSIYSSPFALLSDNLDSVQVIFLDIDMPDLNGLDVAYRLRQQFPMVLIIFVTAWIQYAPYGYQVAAFRYLLKSRLEQELIPCLDDIVQKLSNSSEVGQFHCKDGIISVPFERILFIEGTNHRSVRIHTIRWKQNNFESAGSLNDFEDKLKQHEFLRIQRSFLVNLVHISRLSNYEVQLTDGTTLTTSKKYFKNLKATYLIWKGEDL